MRFLFLLGLLFCFWGGGTMLAHSFDQKPELKFAVSTPCTHTITVFEDQSIADPHNILRRSWAFGDGSAPVQGSRVEHHFSAAGVYLITLSLTEKNGQTYRLSQEIEVQDPPLAPVSYSLQACKGAPVQLLARTSLKADETLVWYTQTSSNQPVHTGDRFDIPALQHSVTYYVAVQSANGCESERAQISAELLPENHARLVAVPERPVLPVAEVHFGLESSRPVANWQWDFGDGVTAPGPSPKHEYRQPGEYEVSISITDEYGCQETIRTMISVTQNSGVQIPGAFSPNADGVNDFLEIEHYNLRDFEIEIFDRHGRRIYFTNDPDFRWDGRGENGQMLPEGEYGFVVQAVDVTGKKIAEKRTIFLIH